MRGLHMRFTAVLMTFFYLAAIGGFDVHSDHESGQTYVRLLSAGISCGDIHPDAPCHHDHTDGCEEEEDCCSDDIEVLSITGDDSCSDDFRILPGVSFCPEPSGISNKSGQSFRESGPSLSLPKGIPPKIPLHEICIMRV